MENCALYPPIGKAKAKDSLLSVERQPWMGIAYFSFAVSVLLAILSCRCLYADGAHEFIKVLQAQNFVSLMWSRHFAFYLFEFPLVLAIKAGVTNLSLLRLAFGIGCFLPWPLALMSCRWLAPQHLWIVALACAAGYLNTAFMAVGEHIIAHAFFWPPLFAILFARPLRPSAAALLLASATVLLFSYESQLLLCALLAALCLWRMGEEARAGTLQSMPLWQTGVWLLATSLFITGSAIGFYAVLNPELPVNFEGFRANATGLIFHLGWTATWTIVFVCLMLAAVWRPRVWTMLTERLAIAIEVVALVLWGTWPLLMPDQLDTARQYDNRALDVLAPIVLLPLALRLKYRPAWAAQTRKQLVRMTALLLAVQSVWHLCATWQWHQDVRRLQTVLNNGSGPIPLHSTILGGDSMESRRGDFDWAWPCLSIALNPGGHIKAMVCAEPYMDVKIHPWQPFQPERAETLPDLRHFGIDFSNYISTIPSVN